MRARQTALTVLTPVGEGRAPALTAVLRRIGDDIGGNPHLRFADLPGLHHASLTVLPPFAAGDRAQLLLDADVDGTGAGFLEDLLDRAGPGIDEIYRHCDGFPAGGAADRRAALAYLARHDVRADAAYVAWPGRTVEEIRREHHLRERIELALDGAVAAGRVPSSPAGVVELIRDHVRSDPDLRRAGPAPPRPLLVRYGRRVRAALAGAAAAVALRVLRAAVGTASSSRARGAARFGVVALVALVGGAAVRLRAAEAEDERREAARPEPWTVIYDRWRAEHLTDVGRREGVHHQNHMTSVTTIKEGRFRLVALRALLRVLALSATLTPARGALGGIPTIHFARWVVTPDRRHLVFLSDHDGSSERILGDVVERAARGATAVWTNTGNAVGFPPTRWLVLGGAEDEARFKAYARTSMVPTQVWYSAYPELPAAAIGAHAALRDELFRPMDDVAARTFLRRL